MDHIAGGDGGDPAAGAAPGRRPWRWAGKVVLAFGAATAAVVLVLVAAPEGQGDLPPVGLLLAAGALVGGCTTAALALVVRRDLALPGIVAVYAVGYNLLVVAVKFVLAPYGVYVVNREIDLEGFVTVAEAPGVLATAAFVFLLYAAAYVAVYRFSRGRLGTLVATRQPDPRVRRRVITAVVFACLFVAAATGGVVVLVAWLLAGAAVEYLAFVFGSVVSLFVALGLGMATWLCTRAFARVTERARVVGDATVLVSFFWLGLAFLALYHALWVVYMLVLVTAWPLRSVVPK